tara:strand:+ start:15822 stop:16895 length:1074 start_codon:yes stop_codon:yes gene_type:complete
MPHTHYPKKNVLIITPTIGGYGGIEAFVINLAHQIQACPGTVVKLCLKRVKGHELQETFLKLLDESKIPYLIVERMSKAVFEAICWADVVHAQMAPPDVSLLCTLLRKPLVLTLHDNCPQKISLHTILWHLSLRLAHARVYVSNSLWNNWEPHGRLKGSLRIPSVPELEEVPVDFDNRKGFLFVGRWVQGKGIEVLLKAYKKASLDPEKWPLLMMGTGPLYEWAQAFVKEHKLQGVELLQSSFSGEKFKIIARSKWMVVPSHFKEPLGMVPLEARYVSVPVIATRDGGLLESAGQEAIFCEPNDVDSLAQALQEAAAIPEGPYRERALKAKESLSHFIIPLKTYNDLYNFVIDESSA